MLALGTPAPDFSLLEPRTGKTLSLADVAGEKGLLVAIICNHCPFVKLITQQLGQLGSHLTSLSVGMVGISANDSNNYPEDAPSEMASIASSVWSTFPYLYDESQNVAKAYQAACTPDFFLFDKDMKLCYRYVSFSINLPLTVLIQKKNHNSNDLFSVCMYVCTSFSFGLRFSNF